MATAVALDSPLRDEIVRRGGEIRAVLARHKLRNPRLFGSVARGDSHAGSDVDILIDAMEHCSLFDLVRAERELGTLFSRKVDLVTASELHPLMHDRVVAQALPL